MLTDWKTIRFSAKEKVNFHAGGWQQWADDFPMLFDLDVRDRRIAKNQISSPMNLWFFEWLTARSIFEETGHHSLVEAYYLPKSHPNKWAAFQRIAHPEVVRLIADRKRQPRTQGPDLFVYSPSDPSDWFFVEAKGPRDRLRASQGTLFAELERISGKPVRLAKCLAAV